MGWLETANLKALSLRTLRARYRRCYAAWVVLQCAKDPSWSQVRYIVADMVRSTDPKLADDITAGTLATADSAVRWRWERLFDEIDHRCPIEDWTGPAPRGYNGRDYPSCD